MERGKGIEERGGGLRERERFNSALSMTEGCIFHGSAHIIAHGRMVTSSPQITEVKQRRARLVLGWVTAVRVTLPAMCRGVGQASHITPPLSTQQ